MKHWHKSAAYKEALKTLLIPIFLSTTGNDNTATGYQALYSNTADNNTATGFQALL